MKFLVKCSNWFIKWFVFTLLRKVKTKSIESVLKNAMGLLEQDSLLEMKAFVRSRLTQPGGFADRSGSCDMYYTLFGYYLTELFSLEDVKEKCIQYVQQSVSGSKLQGVELFCGAILYTKLCGWGPFSRKLRNQVIAELNNTSGKQSGYNMFMGILALYYLGEYIEINHRFSQMKTLHFEQPMACPLSAAAIILCTIAGKPDLYAQDNLYKYYRGNGGFAALSDAPSEDLLSTAVALYSLHFIDADLKLIKPDCFNFVTDLYCEGGFRSMPFDTVTDVEYTFYGLLALGSLHST
jgi:hypothetical protein